MNTRKARTKRIKLSPDDYGIDNEDATVSPCNDLEEARKSRIRDSNKEFARRMTILDSWSDHWTDYSTREGEAYPQQEARDIIKRAKKIACPIASCGKTFTSIGGLKYHYARCNIERIFKCKVCNPTSQVTTRGELLRHMILSHYEDLPPLNTDQREIVNSYLSCENRADKSKKDRKLNTETEHPSSAQRLVKSFFELQTKIYSSQKPNSFLDWSFSEKDWNLLVSDHERRRFYPPEMQSVNFRLGSSSGWNRIKIGESMVLEKSKRGHVTSRVFFTGGINTASAWLPHRLPTISKQDIIAIAVNCCSLDENRTYNSSGDGYGCIQFWAICNDEQIPSNSTFKTNEISFIIGHNYGTIFDMCFCPLGTTNNLKDNSLDLEHETRVGLLALACGDGQLRIISILNPRYLNQKGRSKYQNNSEPLDRVPIFKAKPTACLLPPGVGSSTDYQVPACRSTVWSLQGDQKQLVAGYSNGSVAIFDLENNSPILYSSVEGCHCFRPLKSWVGHGGPVTGVATSHNNSQMMRIATGSTDRSLKLWDPNDLHACITTDRAPVTKILWDHRFRGVVTATDSAFTSFNNRVSYRYPVLDGSHTVTVSTHRSTVWGLSNSLITNSIATSDGAGEVFVMPQLMSRSLHKREKNILSTHSLYTIVPKALEDATSLDCSQPKSEEGLVIDLGSIGESSSLGLEYQQGSLDANLLEVSSDYEDNGIEMNNTLEVGADFSVAERPVANKPSRFLLPHEHRPISTYSSFKKNFGLEYINYSSTATNPESKLPDSCLRAADSKNIYCDRPCDYPFSSIDLVSWSPNPTTFQYLLSASHIGLCRIDRVQIVEQIYKSYVDAKTEP